jgi:hypothetical protein
MIKKAAIAAFAIISFAHSDAPASALQAMLYSLNFEV